MSFLSRLSPLTLRILAVNAMPLIILVVAVLYLSGYQDRLIQNELDSMGKEAHQFAAALGEGAVVSDDDERDLLSPELANIMMWRLLDEPGARVRLFDIRGEKIGDTSLFVGRSAIQRMPLPAPGDITLAGDLWHALTSWLRRHSWSRPYPPYHENAADTSLDYDVVEHALNGEPSGAVWSLKDGHILLGMAMPVQRYKGVLGAVLITREGSKIEDAIHAVRMDIIGLFLLTLFLTILLSLYLARTILRPLQELSAAAEGLKTGQIGALKWQASLPDFSLRGDEIGGLSTALRTMVKALGERMHAIESFAADVAHELKNPLTSLHSAVETALKLNDPQRQQKLMVVIADDVQRLDRLITDISAASRLDAELGRTRAKPVTMGAMLHTIVDLYAPLDESAAPNAPRVLFDEGDAGAAVVLGAPTRLGQVFQNLIDNALSFSPPQGLVTVALARAGDRLRITVSDQGPGIPENKLEAIFDRFYSERPEGEKFGTHSGLGLSIARQIVEAHQGRIWAENIRAEGQDQKTDGAHETPAISGARFIVELPLVKE